MRIGFQLFGGDHWAGGLHYLSNLLSALHELPERPVESVLFVESPTKQGVLDRLRPFLCTDPIRLETHSAAARLARSGLTLVLQRDPVAARAFRDARLDVLFQNMVWYGSRIDIPTVAWIPDFQHRRLPRMFTPFSWAKRELGFQALTRWVDLIMLSSEDARRDCERYYPAAHGRIRVVPFAVQCSERVLSADSDGVRAKYGLPDKFLFFPGQLYKHKNHLGIIEALRRMRAEGTRVVVAVSGDQRDGRNPGHINDVINAVRQYGLEDDFRLLGFVAYDDMLQLMRRSVAVVNASFCEGWSTTVEEAKALGVPLVLSNLDVHREQTGSAALFFNADSPASMATTLGAAWSAPPAARGELERAANAAAANRRLHFARSFVDVARRARGENQSTI